MLMQPKRWGLQGEEVGGFCCQPSHGGRDSPSPHLTTGFEHLLCLSLVQKARGYINCGVMALRKG